MGLKEFAATIEKREFPIDFPGHWVGGHWVQQDSRAVIKSAFNPSRNKKIAEIRLDKGTVAMAVDKASAAQDAMKVPLKQRLEWVSRFRQLIADYQKAAALGIQIGVGKPEWEAQADLEISLAFLDGVLAKGEDIEKELLVPISLGQKESAFTLQPVGVTCAFLPFSIPFTSFVHYFTACMVAGCPLIVMASSHAVLSAIFFAHICREIELPPGVVNIMTGNFTFLQQLLPDNRIQAIIYRGSREHCEHIRKESRGFIGRQLMLYSGGKNSLIIHNTADIAKAVACTIYGAFQSSGQLCTSTSRVFVPNELFGAYKDALMDAVKSIKIGVTDEDGQDPFMGPLYSDKAVEKFLRFQTMAKREAQETLFWGKIYDTGTKGYFVSPGVHVLDRLDNTKAYQSNVLMCPDIAIYRYDNLEDAVHGSNATDAPLVASFVGDPDALEAYRAQFVAPNIMVNLPTTAIEAHMPVTGKLHCGHHRFNGIGLAFQLTYPQSLTTAREKGAFNRTWPWPRN